MLKSKLLHPDILQVLATCGHKAKIMIADGNYSFATNSSPTAKKVYLNLMPGVVKVTEILQAVLSAVNVEAAQVMQAPAGEVADIHDEFANLLPDNIELQALERFAFYDAVRSQDTALVIASGDQRRFANLLLTIGVVK